MTVLVAGTAVIITVGRVLHQSWTLALDGRVLVVVLRRMISTPTIMLYQKRERIDDYDQQAKQQ